MNVRRRGNASRISHQFAHSIDIQRVFSRQEMPQRIGHDVLTFMSRQFQNLHVHFVGHFFCMRGSQ